MSEPPTELESLHHPPDRFRHYLLVLPIIALALSTAFEGYRWTVAAFAGVALVLSGNLLVLLPRRTRR